MNAREELADTLRAAVDAAMVVDATDDALRVASADFAAALERLRGAGPARTRRTERLGDAYRHHDDYLPGSPQIGPENPLSPPAEMEMVDGRIQARLTFGAAYEGPPGYVHGGVIASTFDELLGIANIRGEAPGMTARLLVRYRRPTPLHREVLVRAWHERSSGRRIVARATLHVDDDMTAEAEGLFVRLDAARIAEYFT